MMPKEACDSIPTAQKKPGANTQNFPKRVPSSTSTNINTHTHTHKQANKQSHTSHIDTEREIEREIEREKKRETRSEREREREKAKLKHTLAHQRMLWPSIHTGMPCSSGVAQKLGVSGRPSECWPTLSSLGSTCLKKGAHSQKWLTFSGDSSRIASGSCGSGCASGCAARCRASLRSISWWNSCLGCRCAQSRAAPTNRARGVRL